LNTTLQKLKRSRSQSNQQTVHSQLIFHSVELFI
jgi:hypothetical protein